MSKRPELPTNWDLEACDSFKHRAVQSTVLLFSMKRFPGVDGSFICTTVSEGGKESLLSSHLL